MIYRKFVTNFGVIVGVGFGLFSGAGASAAPRSRPLGFPAVSYEYGFLGDSNCSGSVIDNPDSKSRFLFLTAAHCVNADADITARAGFSVSFLSFLNPAVTPVRLRVKNINRATDLALFPLRGPPPAARVLTLADRQPAPGQPVHFYGYPVVAIAYRPKLDLGCHAVGKVLVPRRSLGAKRSLVFEGAFCDRRYWLGGASGGPVLDAAGRVVGTATGGWQNLAFDARADQRGKVLLVYSPVDRETLSSDADVRAGRRLLPSKTGRYYYDRILQVERAGPESLSYKFSKYLGLGHASAALNVYRGYVDFERDQVVATDLEMIDRD